MKHHTIPTICLLIASCGFVDKGGENAKVLSTELEASKDIIATIQAYNRFYMIFHNNVVNHRCFKIVSKTVNVMTNEKDIYGVYIRDRNCNEVVLQELAQSQVDLGCLYKDFATETYYNSDKCILQRRAHPITNTGFFDYKRFLPESSRVKTDENWSNLVEFYNDTQYCESIDNELTSYELQACREAHNQQTVKLATAQPKMNCKDTYKDSFIEDVIYIVRDNSCGNIELALKAWGEAHMCDIRGWQTANYSQIVRSWINDCGL